MLSRPAYIRGEDSQVRALGRNYDQDGGGWPSLLRTLQGLEANVRLHLAASSSFIDGNPALVVSYAVHVPCSHSRTHPVVSPLANVRADSRWDEWVHPRRLLKLTETNVELQKTLAQANAAAQAPSTSTASGSGTHAKAGCVMNSFPLHQIRC